MNRNDKKGFAVSVVIPAYNAEQSIKQAIDSVMSQTFPVDEIIVIDDGSTDGTAEILMSYGNRIFYLRQDNAGASVARNTGIERAVGNWIAFLDADDQWLPDKLQRQIDHLRENPDIGWSYTNYQFVDNVEKPPRLAFKTNPVQGDTGIIQNYIEAYAQYCIRTSTLIVKKQLLMEMGLFLPHLKISEDNDLFWKIAYKHPKIGYIHQPLLNYQNNLPTSLTTRYQFLADERCDLIEHHLELSSQFGQRDQFCKGISEKTVYWIQNAITHKHRAEAKVLLKRLGYLIPFKLRVTFFIQAYFPYYKKITRKVSALISRKQKKTSAKLKIAMVVPSFPCLSETFILNQITGLIDLKHDVRIIAFNPSRDQKQHPYIVKYRLLDKTTYLQSQKSKWRTRLKAAAQTLSGFLRHPILVSRLQKTLLKDGRSYSYPKLFMGLAVIRLRPHIIHCQFGPCGVPIVTLKEMGVVKGKIVVSFRGYDLSEKTLKEYQEEYPVLFHKADLFLPVCSFFKSILIEKGCSSEKIIVHSSGTDLSIFKKDIRKKNINNQTLTLLTVGRLVEKKGIEYSLRAVQKIISKNRNINIEYLIVGSGPLEYSLKCLAEKLGANNKTRFIGPQDNYQVAEIMRNADILLSSNISTPKEGYDGIPGVIREAMACCLPVIATKTGGIPEIVDNGKSGFLVEEKDINGLAEKLQYLIDNPIIRKEMGKNGKKHVEEKYDIKELNKRIIKLYKTILEE